MNSVIEVKNLTKVYGKRSTAFTALKNINLDIYEGESVAIVGKSGSGKSTLMHLLALLDRPTEGTVKIDGVESTKLKARKLNRLRNRSFGFVFQQFFMNPHDTVLENVVLPLRIAGKRRKERKELATKALKTVGLSDRIKFKANDLSGGQKQRVCIARTIVNNPKILFADEPTGNLDSATGDKVIDLLFGLNKKGVTLIIVTHDDDLAKLCDRQIRISDGKIIEDTGVKPKVTKAASAAKKTREVENTTKGKAKKAAAESVKKPKATSTKLKSTRTSRTAKTSTSSKTTARTTRIKNEKGEN